MSELIIDTLTVLGVAKSVLVVVRLTDSEGNEVVGYTDDGMIVTGGEGRTDSDGHLTLDLVPNADVRPANTYYKPTVGYQAPGLLLKSSGTQTLEEALVDDLMPLDPLALATETAAREAADNALQAELDAEETARAAADTAHEADTTNVHGIADTAQLATKAYADASAASAAAGVVDSAPSTLDTLNELAAALGDDPNLAATLTTLIGQKVPLSTVTADSDLIVGTGNAAVARLAVPASRIIGRDASGSIKALTVAEVKALLAIAPSDVSGFDTQVRDSRLDQMAAPAAAVSLNGQRVTNVADPTSAQDAATRAYVLARIADLVASSPAALDTLNELATALGNDANFATTVTNALAGKASTSHHTTHEPGGSDAMAVDAATATGSLRTLGTGATQAAAGDHLHAGRYSRLAAGEDIIQSRVLASYRTMVPLAGVPSTTIASVVKLYTVPSNYVAFITAAGVNTTAGSINVSLFAMTDGSTPVAADRVSFQAIGANASAGIGTEFVLEAGGTVWAFASASGLNLDLDVRLIPTATLLDTFTTVVIKGVSNTTDQQIYALSSGHAGNWAQSIVNGNVHNTTGSAITLLTKVSKNGAAAQTIWTQSIAANGQSGFMQATSHLRGVLDPGDTLYVVASATGLNIVSLWICERPQSIL